MDAGRAGGLNLNGTPPLIIPARHDPRFARVFLWYARRLLARKFHAVHLVADTRPLADSLNKHPGPMVLALNHASWWDPLVTLVIGRTLLPDRAGIAPIDAGQLARFKFFRKLGLFGLDPDNPQSLRAMLDYSASWAASATRPTIAITPQGRFADVREPVRIRPGAAALAARLAANVRVLVLSIEYAFWQSQRPEVFLRFEEAHTDARIHAPASSGPSTARWQRAIESTMQRNTDELARLVIARDPAPFVPLLAASGPSINPVYDLWLRLRGRSGEIARRPAHAQRSSARLRPTIDAGGGS